MPDMKLQQVNLYLPELRPQRDWLNARFAALLCAAFIAFMLVMQLVWGLRAGALEEQIAQQQAVVADLQAQVDKLKLTSTAVARQPLDETVAQLEAAIANRKKVGRILSGQNMGNSQSFYAHMQSLARESHSDLALERFTFSRGGNYVQMHGWARSAEAIPLYLQRLKNDPVFQQAHFGLLSISSQPDSDRALEFSLGYDNIYRQTSAEDEQQ